MSQALTIGNAGDGGRSPGFVQQGQVDWVAFGRTIYSASLATMQRLASAGIQPVTHGAGLALASQFQLSELGRRRMDEALQNLQSYPGFERVIYFGFGVQSFVRTLAESQLGVNCLALCSCLADSHSSDMVAWTLAELWNVLEFPADFEPSHQQFLALVKCCAGVVATTSFGTTISIMSGRDRCRRNLQFGDPARPHYESRSCNPKDLAKVLHGLFKMSKGMLRPI